MPESSSEKNKIRTRLSKIKFPEQCPVCMEPAEDLVFITIVESYGPDSYETSSWMKGDDKAGAALQSAKSSTTFSVPTCMAHGSKSVRTIRTRFITVMGFFVLFYPIIYYLLQIDLALIYSRPLFEPIIGAILFIFLLISTIFYGLFPRALERGLKFENTSRTKDSVDIIIKNREYRKIFFELNAAYAEHVSDE